jgi:rubrerythrin
MHFRDLSEKQIVALAISAEEEDGRIYSDFAEGLRAEFPATAELFDAMAVEESGHRHRLIDLYRSKFGEHIPLIRREDVHGFYTREARIFGIGIRPERARARAAAMEIQARNFYENATQQVSDASIRQLLGDLAVEEGRHEALAEGINSRQAEEGEIEQEHDSARRSFVLRIVQPGLAGLMDGSVSTLAPLFAAAFATHSTIDTFRVGLAASVGAGISMGFAEALSDDGKISGRGNPLWRGAVCGLMTTLGGIGHTLPYLIGDFHTATAIAVAVVVVELATISWIRWRYMATSPLSATIQVALGGALVFFAGWMIGAV